MSLWFNSMTVRAKASWSCLCITLQWMYIDREIDGVHGHLCVSVSTYICMYVCKLMGRFHGKSVWNKSFSFRNRLDLIHCLNEDKSNFFPQNSGRRIIQSSGQKYPKNNWMEFKEWLRNAREHAKIILSQGRIDTMARSQMGTTHSPAGLLTSPGGGEGSRAATPVLGMAVKSVI